MLLVQGCLGETKASTIRQDWWEIPKIERLSLPVDTNQKVFQFKFHQYESGRSSPGYNKRPQHHHNNRVPLGEKIIIESLN